MLRKILLRLPTQVRHPLMRRLFRFDPDRCERYEVRYAQTAEEYLAAFQLVCDAYEAGGFFQTGDWRRQSDRRLYFAQTALSTSAVVIALDEGRVVGTTTMIRDSAMGVPGAKSFGPEAGPLSARGERMSEMCMLAISPAHRKGGEVLFALQRYAALFALDYEGLDLALCTMSHIIADGMQGLMLFQPMWNEPRVHPLAKSTIMAMYLDYRDIEQRTSGLYRNAPRHRDLRRFIFDDGRANVRFPQAPWNTSLLPKLSPQEFVSAFGEPDDLFATVSELDRLVLHNAFSPAFRAALPDWFGAPSKPEREMRYDANVGATFTGARSGTGRIVQVSEHGALLTTDVTLRTGDSVELEAAVAPDRTAQIRARVVRVVNPRQYALSVAEPDASWREYVQFLEGWLWGADISTGAATSPSLTEQSGARAHP